jgi:hypothetical protein
MTCTTFFTISQPKIIFGCCYYSVNLNSFSQSQSDPIKQRLLCCYVTKCSSLLRKKIMSKYKK